MELDPVNECAKKRHWQQDEEGKEDPQQDVPALPKLQRRGSADLGNGQESDIDVVNVVDDGGILHGAPNTEPLPDRPTEEDNPIFEVTFGSTAFNSEESTQSRESPVSLLNSNNNEMNISANSEDLLNISEPQVVFNSFNDIVDLEVKTPNPDEKPPTPGATITNESWQWQESQWQQWRYSGAGCLMQCAPEETQEEGRVEEPDTDDFN